MTAGNQTTPGGPSDGADRTGMPAEDRPGANDLDDPRVRMVSRAASASAVPPNSMPPRRGEQDAPAEQSGCPSALFDPARPAGPARPTEPAERFPASRLFEPFTPVAPNPGVPGPTVPWGPSANRAAPPPDDDTPAPATESLPTTGASTQHGVTPPASTSGRPRMGGTASRGEEATDEHSSGDPAATSSGPSSGAVGGSAPAHEGRADTSASSPEEETGSPSSTDGTFQSGEAPADDPQRGTPPPGWIPAVAGPVSGSHGGPAAGRHAPPAVPARVPMPPGPGAPGPSAPAATGRLRRLPVVLLVVAVLVAGLGYVGYRQLTGGPPDGYRAAASPGYELDVPQSWTPPPPGTVPLTVFGVPFGTAGQYGDYACKGARFPRAVAASALIAVPADVGLDQAATAFARGSGEALYPGAGPQVAVGTPTERELSRVTGSRVEATVRTDGSGGCRATDATVQVLVVPRTTAPDGSIGAAVLVVSGDLRGGPPQPGPVTRDELVRVLDTAALSTR